MASTFCRLPLFSLTIALGDWYHYNQFPFYRKLWHGEITSLPKVTQEVVNPHLNAWIIRSLLKSSISIYFRHSLVVQQTQRSFLTRCRWYKNSHFFAQHQNYFRLLEVTPGQSHSIGRGHEEWEVFIFELKPGTFREGNSPCAFSSFQDLLWYTMWAISKGEQESMRGMRASHQENWKKNGLFSHEWRNILVESLDRDDIAP